MRNKVSINESQRNKSCRDLESILIKLYVKSFCSIILLKLLFRNNNNFTVMCIIIY